MMEITTGTIMPNNEGKEADWQTEQIMEGLVAGRQTGGEVGKRGSWAARRERRSTALGAGWLQGWDRGVATAAARSLPRWEDPKLMSIPISPPLNPLAR